MLLSMLSPQQKEQIRQAMEDLSSKGKCEAVLEVPEMGLCRITIEKTEAKA
jgi:hypothetical protein